LCDRRRNLGGNIGLNGKNVARAQIIVISLGPEDRAVLGFAQPRRDMNARARDLNTAGKKMMSDP